MFDPGSFDWKLRLFRSAFTVTPNFVNWARTRALELRGEPYELVIVWGRRRFRVGNIPHGEPYFAIVRADGTLERSPWCSD